jgi:hypothetical protein
VFAVTGETDADAWAEVERDVAAALAERPTSYAPGTLGNLDDLLLFLRGTGRPAPMVSPGYGPTFRLEWAEEGADAFEIEVFQDRYEVFRFPDGQFDVRYVYHSAGELLSEALVAELPNPR